MKDTRAPDEILLAMEEAAVLPTHDAARIRLEARVAGAPSEARARWAALVEETESLRRALSAPRLPVGIEARLLTIPAAPSSRRWVRRGAAVAAAAVILAALVLGGQIAWTAHRTTVVAELATANHAHDAHVTLATRNVGDLEDALSSALGFAVVVPELAAGIEIVGGRQCALGDAPVAYIAIRHGEIECALYVFRAEALDLPDTMTRSTRTVQLAGGATAVVDVWTLDGSGFAVVSPSARVLERR